MNRVLRRAILAAVALIGTSGAAVAADISVFAAASLREAVDAAAARYTAETGDTVSVSYAGSSVLARQIDAGAPADIFISANQRWMDELEASGAIDPATRLDLLANTLVLVAPATGTASPSGMVLTPEAVTGAVGDARIAMALVDAVPAGIYGREALTSFGLWERLAPQVVQSDNVRSALALVERGEAPFGIVYATDARAEPGATVLGTFPEGSHAPITYPAARIRDGDSAVADAFLAYLQGPVARAAFERQGFTVLTE